MIKKLKDWLGIEGVKVQIDMDDKLEISEGKLSGIINIASKSEQYLQHFDIVLKEKYTRGRRKSKLIDEYIMGQKRMLINEKILGEELKSIEFSLSFQHNQSQMDKFASKNLLFSGLGSIAKFIKGAKSEFYLTIEANVKGNALKPYHTKQLFPA